MAPGKLSFQLLVALLLMPAVSAADPPRELDAALSRMAELAEVYAHNALRFTADELVSVRAWRGDAKRPSKYAAPRRIYLYYEAADGSLNDRRIHPDDLARFEKQLSRLGDVDTVLAGSAKAGQPPIPSRNYGPRVPFYVIRPFSWIQLFSRPVQPRYHYTVEAGDASRGAALCIGFSPREDAADARDWHGRVCVDPDSLHILHAAGHLHEDELERRRMLAMQAADEQPGNVADRTFYQKRVTTEFEIVERDLRFPSLVRTEIRSHVVKLNGKIKERDAFVITQRFRRYRFFDVWVEVEAHAD